MPNLETYADVQALQERFINASDAERLQMLAVGDFTPTDSILALAVQSIARVVLGSPLERA